MFFAIPISSTYEKDFDDLKKHNREVECLAENIFFEAKSESKKGKIAVAFVTLNRLDKGKYGSSICSVVYQKIKGTCQFSWVCDKSLLSKRKYIKHTEQYHEVRMIAEKIYLKTHYTKDPTFGSTHFHSNKVFPNWNLRKTVVIGNHTFYKEKRI